MRHFPRIARSRTAAALLAVTLATGATTAVTAHADDLKDRERKVEKQIRGAKKDLDHSSATLNRATTRLKTARTQLKAAKAELATARGKLQVAEEQDALAAAQLETAEAELAAAEAALTQGQVDRDAQRQVLANTVSNMYMEGDPELIAFSSLLDAVSTEDLTRRDGVRDVVVHAEARAYDELKAAEVLLGVREEQVETARDAVAEKREEAATNLAVTQQLEAEKEAARSSVSALVSERSQAQDLARKARAKDVKKLKAFKKQQERIKEMLRRRALAALRKARREARMAGQAGGGPSNGVLRYPVDTYVTSGFGYRTHPIYHYWGLHDGVDFGGGCGVPLRAAASGRVIASYWSAVYGRRLIVDHGARAGVGLATIYNHASSYSVGVGAQVEAGQVLGYQGDTGWSTACHLHFTVMANGKPVDPMNWL